MSFFLKGKRASSNSKYGKLNSKKRKLSKQQEPEEEEILSSSEDESKKPEQSDEEDDQSSDNENETAQEKKLRLAKVYLKAISRKERKKLKHESEDSDGASVAKILKEDYLKSTGSLKSLVASRYTGADVNNIKVMRSKDHRSCITCFCLTTQFIYSGSKDGSIVKWSLEECRKVGSIPYSKRYLISNKVIGHMKTITSLAATSDGRFLAASDSSTNIQIWDPDTLKHIETLKGHQHTVTGLVFRKNTHTLYSCSKDRSVKVWSLDEMAYVETMYGHQNHITSIDALSRERAITSGGMDGTIRVWKIVEESQLIYNGPSESIDIVRLLNEETFVSGSADGAINVWGVNKKKPLCTYKPAHDLNPVNEEPYWICSIATLINTDLVATGSQNGCIKLWKLSDNFKSIDLLFTIDVKGFVNHLAFTEDGKFLIAAIGNEHKSGRWNVFKDVKNSIIKIPLHISNKK